MEKVQWKVDGMDCTTCALNIHKYLEKKGMKNVKVNFATGDVLFDAEKNFEKEKISTGINDLGYKVISDEIKVTASKRKPLFSTHLAAFLVLPSFYAGINAAHDTGFTHSLVNESLGSVSTYHSCLYSRDEFLRKKCMEKYSQWNAQYECVDCDWIYSSIHL